MFGFRKKKDLRETADQEKAAKLVVEINERALASGGYVNTYALTLAAVLTSDHTLRERINKLAQAKGVVIRRGDEM